MTDDSVLSEDEGDGDDGDGCDGDDGAQNTSMSIDRLASEARAARESAEPPDDSPPLDDTPVPEDALAAARDGLGPVVARYVQARTGERERLSARQLDQLHDATNDWLAVYALAYGVEIHPDATVRSAAELLVETHDISATAELLTGVPDG